MSCSAVVKPASPSAYADPPGRWSSRNCAVASAEVQMDSSGTSMPLASRRALRSRGVKIELFVSTRKPTPEAFSAAMNSTAPGIGSSSWTRTPSMSVSQVSIGRASVMETLCRPGGSWGTPAGSALDVHDRCGRPGDRRADPHPRHPQRQGERGGHPDDDGVDGAADLPVHARVALQGATAAEVLLDVP